MMKTSVYRGLKLTSIGSNRLKWKPICYAINTWKMNDFIKIDMKWS